MKEELVKMMKETFDAGKIGIMKVGEFMQEQAPELVLELLRWKFAMNLILGIIGALGLIGVSIWIVNDLKTLKEDRQRAFWYTSDGMVGFAWAVCFLPALLLFFLGGGTALKILIAPKLYIFEYVLMLIK